MRGKNRSNDSQSVSKDGEDYEMGLGKGEILGVANPRGFVWQRGNAGEGAENGTNVLLSEQVLPGTEVFIAPLRDETAERALRSQLGENCLRD